VKRFVMLLLAACSAPAPLCSADAGPGCPATFAAARSQCNTACTSPGFACRYPGQGDDTSCSSYALLECYAIDAGVSEWRCGQ
jgi:hypothetical protein